LQRCGLAIGLACLAIAGHAQDTGIRAPSDAIAGNAATIGASGGGSATFFLVGPSNTLKREVQLGQDIALAPKELHSAGRYVAIVCANNCSSAVFYVAPAKTVSVSFLVHPSRVPSGRNDAISGVAIPFDEFHNMVLSAADVQFQLGASGAKPASQNMQTRNGVAWFRTGSGKAAGALQVQASINDVTAKRVVQQVASEACSLRIKGQRTDKGILVETEPVRDCSGNPVPDGTVVTFTAKGGNITSSVDAPVKQDVARARITALGPVVISAASGVAMGNELRVGQKE